LVPRGRQRAPLLDGGDNLFATDRDADAAFRDVLAQEGVKAILGK
jgi:hypothetical protein